MNLLKPTLIAALAVLALPALAQVTKPGSPPPGGAKGPQFEVFKQRALARADKEIETQQQFKTCVTAAQDRAAMQVCIKGRHDAMQKMPAENPENSQDAGAP